MVLGDELQNECGRNRQNYTEREADPDILNETGDEEHHEGNSCNGKCIGDLGGNVSEVVALRACGGHDGGIGNGGAVVTANSTCETCGHTDDEELAAFGEDGNDDRNENTEGTPRSTGRECKEASNDEDDRGEEVCETFGSAAHEIVNVVLRTEQRGDVLERGSEGKNEDCGNHCAEACGKSGKALLNGKSTADRKVCNGDHECDQTAHRKTNGCVGICECGDEISAVKNTADVNEGKNGANDECDDGEDQVKNDTLGVGLVSRGNGFAFNGVDLTGLFNLIFAHTHFAVVEADQCNSNDEYEGEDCVEVVGDCGNEELETLAFLSVGGNCCCPAGDRSDHADGSRGGVNKVSELCAGDLLGVGNGSHNGADGQTVEVVVDEDQDAEEEGCEERADLALDVFRCPSAERRRTACAVNECYEHAELNEEDENTCVTCNGFDETVNSNGVHRAGEAEIAVKQRAGNDTDEKGAVNFFGDQSKSDCDHGGKQSPDGTANSGFASAGFAFCRGFRGAVGASDGRHCAVSDSGNDEKRKNDHRSDEEGDLFGFCHKNLQS